MSGEKPGVFVRSVLLRHVLACALLAAVLGVPQLSPGQQAFKNTTDKPFMIANIGDENGKPYAQLFAMPGAKMIMSPITGWPISGAGFIQAVEGRKYCVSFTTNLSTTTRKGVVVAGIYLAKISWDESGKIVSVEGLSPEIDLTGDGLNNKKIKITSDLTKPKIADGCLYLKVAGKPDQECKMEAAFGKGKSITPDAFWSIDLSDPAK
jgi:hypothetical protein